MELLLKGLAIGFAVAAPVGPIGILCIRRTLVGGHMAGFVSGLGAAAADALYGLIAALGLTLVGEFLIDHVRGLTLSGGLFLLYLGVAEWRSRPPDLAVAPASNPIGLAGDFTSTLFLTLANPMTILSFIAIFTGLGVAGPGGAVGEDEPDTARLATLVAGVFVGSAGWWLTLSSGVVLVRRHLNTGALVWMNRIAGSLIIGFGFYALWLAFR